MPALNQREKRTIQFAAIGLTAYLVLFFGLKLVNKMERTRRDYADLQTEALRLKREIAPYENRVLLTQKLKELFHIDPQKLSKTTIVAEASAAIQKVAGNGGVQLGPIRESGGRASAKEAASMQLQGTGPVQAIMTLLHKIDTLGYPLIVDSLQFSPDPTKPGMLKVNMTIVILDFEQWKKEEGPSA